jgi:PhnB protein
MVDKKPQDSRNITPSLMLKDADKAIQFYKDVFGAVQKFRMDWPEGKIAHAELKIGDSSLMLAEVRPGSEMKPTFNSTFVYVDDVDAVFKKAKDKGAKVNMEVADQFWGDRMASFLDPFGQQWAIATHIEDVSEDEVRRRGEEFFKKMKGQKAA